MLVSEQPGHMPSLKQVTPDTVPEPRDAGGEDLPLNLSRPEHRPARRQRLGGGFDDGLRFRHR